MPHAMSMHQSAGKGKQLLQAEKDKQLLQKKYRYQEKPKLAGLSL